MKYLREIMCSMENQYLFYFFPEVMMTTAFVIYFCYKIAVEIVFKNQVQNVRNHVYDIFLLMYGQIEKTGVGEFFIKQYNMLLFLKRKFFSSPLAVEEKRERN